MYIYIPQRPFRAKSNETLQEAILTETIRFPDEPVLSLEAKDFVLGLLNRNVSERLGVTAEGFQRLQSHPWLKGLAWDAIESKEAQPPFVPDASIAFKVS